MKHTSILALALYITASAFTPHSSQAGGSVTGTVIDARGEAVAGALVTIIARNNRPGDFSFYARTQTSVEGTFHFEAVPEGPCLITAAARLLGTASSRLFIETNAEATIVLQLPHRQPPEEGTGSLVGIVLNAEGEAVANATIMLLPNRLWCNPDARPIRLMTQTDAQGNFRIESIRVGVWNVFATSGRIRLVRGGMVEIEAGVESSIQILLGRH